MCAAMLWSRALAEEEEEVVEEVKEGEAAEAETEVEGGWDVDEAILLAISLFWRPYAVPAGGGGIKVARSRAAGRLIRLHSAA